MSSLLALIIRATGYTPHLTTPNGLGESIKSVLKIGEIRGLLNPVKHFLLGAYPRRVARRCKAIKPDYIHIHNDPFAVEPLRRKLPRSKIILHMNNDHLIDGPAAGIVALRAVQSADEIAFCSGYTRDARKKDS